MCLLLLLHRLLLVHQRRWRVLVLARTRRGQLVSHQPARDRQVSAASGDAEAPAETAPSAPVQSSSLKGMVADQDKAADGKVGAKSRSSVAAKPGNPAPFAEKPATDASGIVDRRRSRQSGNGSHAAPGAGAPGASGAIPTPGLANAGSGPGANYGPVVTGSGAGAAGLGGPGGAPGGRRGAATMPRSPGDVTSARTGAARWSRPASCR